MCSGCLSECPVSTRSRLSRFDEADTGLVIHSRLFKTAIPLHTNRDVGSDVSHEWVLGRMYG